MYTVGILTLSDKGSKGLREDISGQTIKEILESSDFKVIEQIIISDDYEVIKRTLVNMCDNLKLNLIVTTGGTGFSQRDNTPEATKEILEKEVPGISEAMRAYSLSITKRAMLSRGVSGIRGKSLVINLPGSPKAVKEVLTYIISELPHGLDIMLGDESECARN